MKKTLFLIVIVTASQAFAWNHIKRFFTDRWELNTTVDFIRSDAVYTDQFGEYEKLPPNNYYQQIDTHLGLRYSYERAWSLWGRAHLPYAMSDDGNSVRTNSGLSHLELGTEYLLSDKNIRWVAEFSTLMALNRYSISDDVVYLNEGANEYRFLLNMQKDWSDAIGYLQTGFNYRDYGRSGLIPIVVGIGYKSTESIFGFELKNQFPIKNQDESQKSRAVSALVVNGRSTIFASESPTLVDSEFYWRTKLNERMLMTCKFGATITGQDTGAYYHFGIGISYFWGDEKIRKEEIMPVLSADHNTDDFETEIEDGVDQSFFKSDSQEAKVNKTKKKRKKQSEDIN